MSLTNSDLEQVSWFSGEAWVSMVQYCVKYVYGTVKYMTALFSWAFNINASVECVWTWIYACSQSAWTQLVSYMVPQKIKVPQQLLNQLKIEWTKWLHRRRELVVNRNQLNEVRMMSRKRRSICMHEQERARLKSDTAKQREESLKTVHREQEKEIDYLFNFWVIAIIVSLP